MDCLPELLALESPRREPNLVIRLPFACQVVPFEVQFYALYELVQHARAKSGHKVRFCAFTACRCRRLLAG